MATSTIVQEHGLFETWTHLMGPLKVIYLKLLKDHTTVLTNSKDVPIGGGGVFNPCLSLILPKELQKLPGLNFDLFIYMLKSDVTEV